MSYRENKSYKSKQIMKESDGTGKYPHSRGVLLRTAEGHSTSKESKVIRLRLKERLLKLQESNQNLLHFTKPRPRKIQ